MSAVKVNLSFNIPQIWTVKDSQVMALDTIALIKMRTYRGLDSKGRGFKPYSTKPLYIRRQGAPLSPKGGRRTKSGKSVFYKRGYWEYKHKSRRRRAPQSKIKPGSGGQTSDVDLTLSGNMMNNLVMIDRSPRTYTIGLDPSFPKYGYDVNAERSFIGLSPADVTALTNAVAARIRRKLA